MGHLLMMNKKTKGVVGLVGTSVLAGAAWLSQSGKPKLPPRPPVEPECASSLSYPDRLSARLVAGTPKDGRWEAVLTARPPNAPCWMSYFPVATDDRSAKGMGTPIVIHIK